MQHATWPTSLALAGAGELVLCRIGIAWGELQYLFIRVRLCMYVLLAARAMSHSEFEKRCIRVHTTNFLSSSYEYTSCSYKNETAEHL